MPDKIRVLYVDDEPDLLELGKVFLEENKGFSVTTVISPEAALEILPREQFDAIVSDYQMENIDGIALLKIVRQRFGDIPFILFTGRGREEVAIGALNNGADFYLQKGGDPEAQFVELAHKIRQSVRARQAETSLAENRDYLDRIYTSVQSGIVIIDAKTHEILDLNPAAERMMGTTREQIIGRVCHQFICPAELGMCPITDLHQNVDNSERVLVTADGKRRDIIKYVVPFNLHGRECLLETFLDNTERKAATDNLQAAYEKLTVAEEELRQNYEVLIRKEQTLRENEEQLKETNTYLSNLITYAANPIVTWDIDSRITGFNKAFEKLTGFSEANVLGHDFDVLFPEDSRSESLDHVVRALFGKRLEGVEIPVKTIHGGTSTVIWNSANVYAADGVTPLVTIAMGTDITERKKAELELIRRNKELHDAYEQIAQTEEELRGNYETLAFQELSLRESEEKFRVLVESSLDGILITDTTGKLLFSNAAAGRIVEAEDYQAFMGKKSIFEFVAPGSQAAVLKDFSEVMQGRDAYLVSYQLITGKGQTIWVECIGRKITFRKSPAMLVSLRDVTDRKKAEEELRESEEIFRKVFSNAGDMITLVENTPAGPGRFLLVNDRMLGTTGYTRDEILRMSPQDLVPPEIMERVRLVTREKIYTSGEAVFESAYRKKDGSIVPVEVSLHRFRYQGKDVALSHIRDITERRQADEALRQANRKLHLLSSITRHDIKNQLMTLDGYVGLLKKRVPADCCEEEIARIRKVSGQISSMIQFTKDYQQVGIHSPVWQDLRALIDNAGKGIVPGNVMLKNDIPTGTEVYADPLIAKVLFNLVDNALRHGVSVATIRFSLEIHNGDCTIVCEDDGAGVALEFKKKLFKKGFGKNNGFGLFISREVLDITGITIQETGTPGKGARFEIAVPKGSFRQVAGR